MLVHVPPHIFREYDIRGVADRDLGDELAHALGLALATMLPAGPKRRLALARDCRLSSERLMQRSRAASSKAACT